jgi:cytochrome c oxidase subunit II
MKTKFGRWSSLLAAIWPVVSIGQITQVDRGRQIYVICGACHGAGALGEQRLDAPSLIGQQEGYLLRQLRNFRSGVRGGRSDDQARQMQLILETVSNEADWKAVIAYLRSLPVQRPKPSVRGDVERGRRIYDSCAGCHGSNAEGKDALDAPSLFSLPDWYIVHELRKFRAGTRGAAAGDLPGARMRAAAATLRSEEDIRAVAAFVVNH